MNTIDQANAHMKWCPFARCATNDAGAYNRNGDGGTTRTSFGITSSIAPCVGPKCMAWQQTPTNYDRGYCGLTTART